MKEQLSGFRLVAEMQNGDLYAVNLTDAQDAKFNKVLGSVLAGKASLQDKPFANSRDMQNGAPGNGASLAAAEDEISA